MKKKILTTFLLCLTVFAATSCGSKNASSTETVSPETQQQTESFSETENESSETESQTESVETTAQTETLAVSDASLSFPFEDFGIDIDIPDDWEIIESDPNAESPSVSYRCEDDFIGIKILKYDESISSISEIFFDAPLSSLKDDDSYSEFYTDNISVDGRAAKSTMFYYKNAFTNHVSIDTGHSIVYAYITMKKTSDYGEEIIDNSIYDEFADTIDNMKFSE